MDGVYIIGTTGGGYGLTNNERLAIAKAWRQAIDEQNVNLFTVIHVTSMCLKEALQLTKQVEAMGFDAIAVLPPYHFKPTTVQQWVDYLKLFGNSAPNTPIMYYHNQFRVGEFNCKTNFYFFLEINYFITN